MCVCTDKDNESGRGRGRESSAAPDEAVTSVKPDSKKDQSRSTMQEPSLTRPHPLHGIRGEAGKERDIFTSKLVFSIYVDSLELGQLYLYVRQSFIYMQSGSLWW